MTTFLVLLLFRLIIHFVRFIYKLNAIHFINALIQCILERIFNYRRVIILKNLQVIASSGINISIKESIHRYYIHLSKLFTETLWSLRATPYELKSKIRLMNPGQLENTLTKGKNFTLLLSHIGNWELFCQWAPLVDPRLNVVILYTPLKNKVINKAMLKLRERTGARLVSTKETLELYRLQKQEGITVNLFAADQNPGDPYHQRWMLFFNKKVPVISGPEKFASKLGQDCYYLHVESRKGIYELTLIPISYPKEHPEEITDQYFKLLERNISIDSSLWLLSHNRFKYSTES